MTLHPLDAAVVVAFLLAVVAVGLAFGRGGHGSEGYFLGGRRLPWLVVGLSIVAAEVSALTFIGVPADAFKSDWAYLQAYFGSFVGRLLILWILLPAFYGAQITTIYEYLGRRFGPHTRTTAALCFLVSRVLGAGIRLLAASMAIAVVSGWPLTMVIIFSAAAAAVYTLFGGIKAVVWTHALMALVFMGGALAAIVFLWAQTPGPGPATSPTDAAAAVDKFRVFVFDADPNNERALWVLFIWAAINTMASMGADQDLTQHMLTCPDLARARRSLLFNAFAGFFVVVIFLTVGTLIFQYYQSRPLDLAALAKSDHVFPYFIANALPIGTGLKGLLVAAILAAAMSSLDSPLGALTSSAVNDIYRPFIRPGAEDAHYVSVARWCVFAFAVLLVGVALAFASRDELLWEAFKWASLVFGAMLGVFLLGILTPRGRDGFNPLVMLSSVLFLAELKWLQESTDVVYIAWPWWVVIGTAWTLGFGAATAPRGEPRELLLD